MVRLVSFSLLLCAVSAEGESDIKTTSAQPSTRPAKASPAWDTWKVKDGGSCTGEQIRYESCEGNPPCQSECDPIDCEVGKWHEWSACTCEGLKERNRLVSVHNNECGKPCNKTLTETAVCETECLKEATDAVLGDWGKWAACEGTAAQTYRERTVLTPAANGGKGVGDCMRETKSCPPPAAPDDKDCEWSEWSGWSACTCSCAGGQKTRDRSVVQAPRGKGKHCDALAKTQVSPCNTAPCGEACIDGTWNDWQDWEGCTAECGGGTTWRRRTRAQEANHCGKPALGKDSEGKACNVESCNQKVDCTFGEWGMWSACSCTCEGVQHRNRQITQYGKGDGVWCLGAMKQLEACNNYTDTPNCASAKEPAVDCKLSEWGVWGDCTATCDGGQQTHKRSVVREAKNGGVPCENVLEKTRGCNTQPCETVEAIPCQWNDWSAWGACDKCGGQRKRSRNIKVMPKNGGEPCHFAASEETDDCPRVCHAQLYCEWGEWAALGNCSTSCGDGFIKRKRTLGHKTKPQALFDASDMPMPGQYRFQDVFVSFACGGLITFSMMFLGMRILRAPHRSYANLAPMVEVE